MTKDEALKKAFKQAFQLGQDYWYQADHEYVSQNKKSDVTRAKFEQLMEDAIKEALTNDALEKKAENARELGLDYEPEPVAWMCADESLINKGYVRFSHVCMGDWKIPVYTTKPQRTWVGLTDEEIAEVAVKTQDGISPRNDTLRFAIAIEAKLRSKNHD